MSVKRFGPRYGLRVKKKLRQVEADQKSAYKCISCAALKAKRVAAGIWQCRKCNAKFTGGSYSADYKREEI